MKTFCTIITSDYKAFAKVLFHSLKKQDPDSQLQVLVVDEETGNNETGITFHSVEQVASSRLGKNIVKKYAHTNSDYFRWALKPLFISHLLQHGFDKVIFADPDIYFINKYDFLFEKLKYSNVLLSPHWSETNPLINEQGLYHLLQDGLFNAGFIGANGNALNPLVWWAEVCHFKMDKDSTKGMFVDQKYLDLLPVMFENIEILKHKGCNLASWNASTCRRELVDGKLMINGECEPVFIHFAKETIANILNGNDRLLSPYLEEYSALLKTEGFDLHKKFNDLDFSLMNRPVVQLKHWLRIRTRLKRFLYNLAERI